MNMLTRKEFVHLTAVARGLTLHDLEVADRCYGVNYRAGKYENDALLEKVESGKTIVVCSTDSLNRVFSIVEAFKDVNSVVICTPAEYSSFRKYRKENG